MIHPSGNVGCNEIRIIIIPIYETWYFIISHVFQCWPPHIPAGPTYLSEKAHLMVPSSRAASWDLRWRDGSRGYEAFLRTGRQLEESNEGSGRTQEHGGGFYSGEGWSAFRRVNSNHSNHDFPSRSTPLSIFSIFL